MIIYIYIICGLGPRSCCKGNPSECSVWRHDTIYKIIENSDHLEENWLKSPFDSYHVEFHLLSLFQSDTVLSFFLKWWILRNPQGSRVPFQKITFPQGSKSPPTSLTQSLKSWTCCVQIDFAYTLGNITWRISWKTKHLKMYLLPKMMIFYCHVCFGGKYSRFDALEDFLALNSRYEFSLYVTVATKPTMKLHSQTLNVWYTYLHLPSTKCGCKYTSTIHWMSGIGIVSCVSTCIIPTKLHDYLPIWNRIPQFTRKSISLETFNWLLSIRIRCFHSTPLF